MDARVGPYRRLSTKNWCFWTVVLEKTLESPLDFKEIQPVHPKGNQSWVFIGRTDAEAEAPILWPPDAKSRFIGKDPDVGERLKAGGEGDDRGWNGWMASPTQWTWVWVSPGKCWRTRKAGILQSIGWQRVSVHDWVNKTNKSKSKRVKEGSSSSVFRASMILPTLWFWTCCPP